MSPDQTASLIYLLLLGLLIGSYVFVSGRRSLGRNLRHASLWALIFLGVIVGYGLWGDLRDTVIPRQSVFEDGARIEVPLGPDGHYHMILEVNGTPVRFVVDTGASDIVLSRQDAERAGIEIEGLPFLGIAETANGQVRTARVRLETLALGGLVDRDVPAVVNAGDMRGSLLGMAYLNDFAEVSFGNRTMVLQR